MPSMTRNAPVFNPKGCRLCAFVAIARHRYAEAVAFCRIGAFGITPVGSKFAYPEYAMINRESHRIAYIKDLRAGPMDFGGGPIVLFSPSQIHPRSHLPGADVDGMVGADILTRYKAVINCLTQIVYFKTEPSAHLRLVSFLAGQHLPECRCERK
jgi:hypothetical protein